MHLGAFALTTGRKLKQIKMLFNKRIALNHEQLRYLKETQFKSISFQCWSNIGIFHDTIEYVTWIDFNKFCKSYRSAAAACHRMCLSVSISLCLSVLWKFKWDSNYCTVQVWCQITQLSRCFAFFSMRFEVEMRCKYDIQ